MRWHTISQTTITMVDENSDTIDITITIDNINIYNADEWLMMRCPFSNPRRRLDLQWVIQTHIYRSDNTRKKYCWTLRYCHQTNSPDRMGSNELSRPYFGFQIQCVYFFRSAQTWHITLRRGLIAQTCEQTWGGRRKNKRTPHRFIFERDLRE